MSQFSLLNNEFLNKFYCSDPFCIKNKTGYSSLESQRCLVCDEPARLPELFPFLGSINPVIETVFSTNDSVSNFAGIHNLYFKDEGQCPSGSFKDRGSFTAYLFHTLQATRDKRSVDELILGTVSTGNMAISTAWMGNVLGIKNFVVVHKNTGEEKLETIEKAAGEYGTTIFLVGGEYSEFHQRVYGACRNLRRQGKLVFAELTDDVFRILGYSTLFSELFEQCEQENIQPDFIIIPGASGALFRVAVWSFNRLKEDGFIKKIPKMVLVQEKGGDPIVQAAHKDSDYSDAIEMQERLVASAINVSNSRSGNAVLRILKKGKHLAVSVSSDEILEAKEILNGKGIFAEEASVASFAAAKRLKEEGVISEDDTAVCILTGMDVAKRDLGKNFGTSSRIKCGLEDLSKTIVEAFGN